MHAALLEFHADYPAGAEDYPSFLWRGNEANPSNYLDGFCEGRLICKVCLPESPSGSCGYYLQLHNVGFAASAYLAFVCEVRRWRSLALKAEGSREDPQHCGHDTGVDRIRRLYGMSF